MANSPPVPVWQQKIENLLECYVDGRDIFKKAPHWDYPVQLKPEHAERDDLPDSWLQLLMTVFEIMAKDRYGLDIYPNEIRLIDSKQMLDAYASIGLPIWYDHWSFGKERERLEQQYSHDQMGLAYEIVINTNPAISYNMVHNSKTMMALVLSHANIGHNLFFRQNYLFRDNTDAQEILIRMHALAQKVRAYGEQHGADRVERLLDAAHALENHGVFLTPRRASPSPRKTKERAAMAREQREQTYNDVFARTLPKSKDSFDQSTMGSEAQDANRFIGDENILVWIAENAPKLEDWECDILLDIAYKAQYFFPQSQTKVMNEGTASRWHYRLMNDMYDLGLFDDGMMLEFLQSHSGVLFQPSFDKKYYSGINPYVLGFKIFEDIERICTQPTDEDRAWFPYIAGNGKPHETELNAMRDFRDDSFIAQFLSPKVMRDMRLFVLTDDPDEDEYGVSAIHDDTGYESVRARLAAMHSRSNRVPDIVVAGFDRNGDRSLTLRHTVYEDRPLDKNMALATLRHVHALWGYPVVLDSINAETGEVMETLAMGKTQSARKRAKNDPSAP